jgi:BASS family bile acid:Na+ symporter
VLTLGGAIERDDSDPDAQRSRPIVKSAGDGQIIPTQRKDRLPAPQRATVGTTGAVVTAFPDKCAARKPMRQVLSIDYATYEYCVAATQLVLATLGMSVGLRLRDFGQVLCSPRGLALVFVAQLFVSPLLALAIDIGFDLPPGFALGLVLMAAMPVGAMAGIFVHLGRGHVALSLAATGLTTLTSLLTAPAILHALGSSQFPADVKMPLESMLLELGGYLLLPLMLAMLLARVAPRWSGVIGTWCVRGSLVTLTALVVGSLGSGRLQLAAYGWRAPLAIAAFAAAMLVLGCGLGWLLRLAAAESFTVGVLATIRNGNLGLLLKASLLGGAGPVAGSGLDQVADAVLYVVLLYSAAALVVSGAAAFALRAKERAAGGDSAASASRSP